MDAAHFVNVDKFIFLGSECIYPRICNQPIKEEYLMTGLLEPTNSAYALAKIAGIEAISSYRKQFGRHWISIMPTNLYGPHDNFNEENGHVLPALIAKFYRANQEGKKKITLWGSGTPRREFLHVDDLASAILMCMESYDDSTPINVGIGEDIAISDLALLVKKVAGYEGEICWDTTKPDGTPRRVLDVSRITELGWLPRIDLESGIQSTWDWYVRNQDKIRN
jgi:GDP-L-fucose synthase